MSKTQLVETAVLGPKKGNRWKVVLAVPGKGMKGTYSADVLREDGPIAFPPGTKSWIGHDLPQNRNPKDLFGKYPDGAYYDDNYDVEKYPEGALVAELEVRNQYKELAEELGEDGALSIFADGDKDARDNVTAIYPGRANSVDLVAYGGLEGAGLKEKLYETFSIQDPSGDLLQDKGREKMDKELVDAFAEIKTSITSLVETLKSDTSKQITADAEKLAESLVAPRVEAALADYDEKVTAIEAADLLPSMVESLKLEARKGTDVTPLIESAKKIVDEAKATLKESLKTDEKPTGFRLNESASGKDEDFTLGRWNS